jgi:exopolyphosphatase / guanosine-5'-triphosphate,3'-diphosphate pyrophosphatase
MRDASTRELQRRFMVDVQQADRVVGLADALYAMVPPPPAAVLSKEQRRELRRELSWAAALHEVGMMVSHHDHHRHSAYLLAHVDAAGFSQSQQRRLADLVLAQRGSLRKIETSLANEAFAWQALCLRLAIIKCHARRPVDFTALALRRGDRQARLGFAPGWVERNPRTMHLLNEEASAWERHGPLRLSLAA